jgi:SAM-dependent methyltransferase
MRARLLDLVVCPVCSGALTLERGTVDGDEIIDGNLPCKSCGRTYAIERGIPRLLPSREVIPDETMRTVDRFGASWNQFNFIGPHYEEQFLKWISPNPPEVFRDKIVLEGGCGKGRHSALAARFGARDVLAIDLSSSVETAYRNTRGYPNVHVIQADLFHLPVKNASVDVAFSLGVLHHTPDPRAAFHTLVRTAKPEGRVIVWVYGRENNGWIVHGVNPIREAVTSRLPHSWVYQLAKVPAAALFAVGRSVYRPLSKPPLDKIGRHLFYHAYISYISSFPFEEIHSIVHDHLTPPIAYYISRDEIESWFAEAKLENVVIGWHNENSWRGTGIVPRRQEAAPVRVVEAG